ncbi:KH domain-containing protein [Nosema granulosis]|uniref:KH domain-containing protein n=1 Tax=Nosema granulosis TaxID=83296 RepID=A0A9P6H0F3_9MICR|nr:KH domain-containing protein [Nosema granulosis]
MNNPRFIRSTSNLAYSTVYVSVPYAASAPMDMVQYLYHEIFIDLQKSLIGVCRVSKQMNLDNSISFVVEGILSVSYIMKIVRKSYRYIYEIEVPLCLYSMKNELYRRSVNIMNKHKSMIYVQITNKVVLYLGGRFEDVVECRLEIMKIIEEMMGFQTQISKGRFDLPFLIKKGYRIYMGSLINSDSMLLSLDTKNNSNTSKLPFEEKDRVESFEMVYLDSMKYAYLLLYKKYEMDNVLASYSTYITELETSNKTTKIMFMSLSKKNLKLTLAWFNKLYNSVIVANFSQPVYGKIDSLIIFENSKDPYSTVVGEISKIKEIITTAKGDFEAFMDVEGETLDFLCGKKNGKIIKIMKGLGCIIEVTKKTDFDRSCVYIKGRLAVFKVALSMVMNEFPEYITFSIDERHHKRIIGYGGKNIQKMMKKHGVYIKFMSRSEMEQEGYEHNVVIKTPRKNANNLEKMKSELFEMIEEIPEETTKWHEVGSDRFFNYPHATDFTVYFDKFLVRTEIPKIYYYDTTAVPKRSHKIVLSNKKVFFCSDEKVENKHLTVNYWLMQLPESERLLYIFNINGIITFDTLYEDFSELMVVDSRFLN